MRGTEKVELRQLRYFVTLAEELNFRRAAERLFITQPSLSHQIALLEGCLGARLFRRDRRGVSLTSVGREMLDDARRVLDESDALVRKAKRLAADDASMLHVGYPEFANRTFIPEVVSAFGRQRPEVRLQLSEGYSRNLIQQLRRGVLDAAFVALPAAEDLKGLQCQLVIDEKAGLLLSAGHRLARLSEIPVEALAKEEILLLDRPVNPPLYDSVVGWFREAGLEPRFVKVGGSGVYTFDTALRVIESGQAVSFSPDPMTRPLPDGIVYRPIRGSAPRFQMGVVWSPVKSSPALLELVDMFRSLGAQPSAGNRSVRLTA